MTEETITLPIFSSQSAASEHLRAWLQEHPQMRILHETSQLQTLTMSAGEGSYKTGYRYQIVVRVGSQGEDA